MGSRVILRRSSDVLRKSYLKGAVGTPQTAALDAGGPSMLIRSQFDPSLEINYVDDPRLAVGETFTRATIRTVRDFEGRTLTLKSGEAGFWGFRRVENLVATKSEDLTNAAWTKFGASASAASRLKEDSSNGEHRATQVLTHAAGAMAGQFEAARVPGSTRDVQIDIANGGNSLTLKVNLSTGAVISSAAAGTVSLVQAEVERSNDRWRVKIAGFGFSANSTFAARMLDAGGNVSYQGDGQSEVTVTRFQATLQNGQSYIGATEYASVGVLATPFHGANVDGVKYFVTDYAGVAIKRYTGDTIKYLQLVGQAGGYVSTPDSAAASITGDIDIRAQLSPNAWAPATTQRIITKRTGVPAAEFDFALDIASGKLSFHDGVTDKLSSIAVPFVAGSTRWVRVTRVANSGLIRFYTSLDGVIWTQLGADVVGAAGSLGDTANAVFVGIFGDATASPFAGQVLRVTVRNGIGGAVVLDCNPTDAAAAGSASWASSTTGETWTVTGNNTVARVNTYTKMGRGGLYGEVTATNLTIQSADLSDAAYTKTRTTASVNAIAGLDGSLIGDKLVEDATAAATHVVTQAFVKAASALAYTFTAYLRAGERSAARLDVFNGANGAFARFNLLDGTVLTAATLFGAGFATTSASIEQVRPGEYACTLTVTSDATAALSHQIGLYNAADAYNGDAASGLYVLGQQLEQRATRTTYIPTAAAAVPRNLDAPTLLLGTWFNQLEGTIAAKGMTTDSPASQNNTLVSVNDGSNNERYTVRLNVNGTRQSEGSVVDGGAFQAQITPAATPAAGAYSICALAFKLNDFAACADGGTVVTDVVGTLPTPTLVQFGNNVAGSPLNGCVSRVWIYDRRIPDGRLASIMSGI